jgi:hypothetical protein
MSVGVAATDEPLQKAGEQMMGNKKETTLDPRIFILPLAFSPRHHDAQIERAPRHVLHRAVFVYSWAVPCVFLSSPLGHHLHTRCLVQTSLHASAAPCQKEVCAWRLELHLVFYDVATTSKVLRMLFIISCAGWACRRTCWPRPVSFCACSGSSRPRHNAMQLCIHVPKII